MLENNQTVTPVCYFDKTVPIWASEGVTEEKAVTTGTEINTAYRYLINQNGNFYSKILEKLQEIHIVAALENKEFKYDLKYIGNKVILKLEQDITYTEAIYCIMGIMGKIGY